MAVKKPKKAQASLEYLLTYGWALVMIATIIGVLVFISDSDTNTVSCTSFLTMICKGIGTDGDAIILVLQNAASQRIAINPLTSFSFDWVPGSVAILYEGEEYSLQSLSIASGAEFTIRAEGQANAKDICITFIEEGTDLERTLNLTGKNACPADIPVDTPGIDNCAELQEINDAPTVDYYLAKNINCDVPPYNQGSGFQPIDGFTGTFDGQGHTITGLYINRPLDSVIGLFKQLDSSGTVTDVTLVNVNITGKDRVGSMAGTNRGTISQVNATGNITSSGINTVNIGGLVGYNFLASISQSSFSGDVRGEGSSSSSNVGGIAGSNNGTISKSYSTGLVRSKGTALGGLVGANAGSISDCYSTSDVVSVYLNSIAGGFVGRANSSSITNSYSTGAVTAFLLEGGFAGDGVAPCTSSFWDTQTSGEASSVCGAVGKTTAEMQTADTFTAAGWNTSIWNLVDGSYPTLK